MHFIYYDERTQKKYLICVRTKYNGFFLCFFLNFTATSGYESSRSSYPMA